VKLQAVEALTAKPLKPEKMWQMNDKYQEASRASHSFTVS